MPSWSPCADRSTSARPSMSRLLINLALKAMHRRQENVSSISLLLSRLLILSFRGTLEALQGIFYAGSDGFRAKCFEEPTPPAWGEDRLLVILDAAGGRVDGIAGDVCFPLQSEWGKSMQAELVSFGIDLFDLEDEVQGSAKGFSCEVDGLAYGGWTFWLTPFCLERAIKPLGPAVPLNEDPPDHLDLGCDDGGGTDCQTHRMFLLSISGWRQGTIYALPPSYYSCQTFALV